MHDDAKNGFTVNLAIYSKQKRGIQVFVSDNGVYKSDTDGSVEHLKAISSN